MSIIRAKVTGAQEVRAQVAAFRGEDGKDGYTPIKGVDYFDGKDGAAGPQGPAGPKGEKGDKGDKGEQGPAGAGASNLLNGSGAGSIRMYGASENTAVFSAAMNGSEASGQYSFATGTAKATESWAVAESFGEASGFASHAEGESIASGRFSHAEGDETVAVCECQHTQGKYNIVDEEGRYAHIVGNGDTSVRSNAHTLDWHGNAWFKGKVYVGGTSMDDAAELGTGGGDGLPAGGEAHQVLVTDADGNAKWEEKPFYDVSTTIFPLSEGIWLEESSMFVYTTPLEGEIVVGETYIVNCNGTDYECPAFEMSIDDEGTLSPAVGNPAAAGGEANDVPITLVFVPPDQSAELGFTMLGVPIFLTEAKAVVSIVKGGIKKIDEKYLPTDYGNADTGVYDRAKVEVLNSETTDISLLADTRCKFIYGYIYVPFVDGDSEDTYKVSLSIESYGIDIPLDKYEYEGERHYERAFRVENHLGLLTICHHAHVTNSFIDGSKVCMYGKPIEVNPTNYKKYGYSIGLDRENNEPFREGTEVYIWFA